MMMSIIVPLCSIAAVAIAPTSAYSAFVVPTTSRRALQSSARPANHAGVAMASARTKTRPTTATSSSALSMIDSNIIQGAGIAVAGLAVGIGIVAFTENQGERSRSRGAVSEQLSTKLTGGLMEDVEVDSVEDLSSLTGQLEKALMDTGGVKDEKAFELTEEKKKKIAEEADDGW